MKATKKLWIFKLNLALEAKLLDECLVRLVVVQLEILQVFPSISYHLEKSTT